MDSVRSFCSFLFLVVLVGSPGALAQECDFDDVDFEYAVEDVLVELPNGLPAPGRTLCLGVTVDLDVIGEGTLFYRPTGSTQAYTSTQVGQSDGRYTIEIPGEAFTERGLDVYGVGTLASGETYTFPLENPAEDPIHVPVFIGRIDAPLNLPPRAFRMVSVAVDPEGGSIGDLVRDDFGDDARWRVARWDPTLGRYLGTDELTSPVQGGEGYWLITAEGGTFDVALAQSTNPDSLDTIELLPGFNQIANPYAFPVSWSQVAAASGFSLDEVSQPVAFDGDSMYVPVGTLEPWNGYFVENKTGASLFMTVPPVETSGGTEPIADEAPYAIRVGATAGRYADHYNVLALDTGALDGRDARDLAEPPTPGEHLRLSIVDEDGAWLRSVKAAGAEGAVWNLDVTATEEVRAEVRRVRVTLDEAGTRPAGFGLYVLDRDRGAAVAVVDGAFEVMLNDDAPVRRFRVITGTEAFAQTRSEGSPLEPTAFGLDGGYPNPFSGQTTITYRLDEREAARVEVFDLLGRRVGVLADGLQRAGAHTVTWDGNGASGQRLASGVYVVRLRAGGSTATRRITLLR